MCVVRNGSKNIYIYLFIYIFIPRNVILLYYMTCTLNNLTQTVNCPVCAVQWTQAATLLGM